MAGISSPKARFSNFLRATGLLQTAPWRAVPAYLAMSYLYKKSNRLWHLLIKHRLTATVWRPLVEITRWRHVQFRQRLRRRLAAVNDFSPSLPDAVVPAGV